jgi:hypothetical protein
MVEPVIDEVLICSMMMHGKRDGRSKGKVWIFKRKQGQIAV